MLIYHISLADKMGKRMRNFFYSSLMGLSLFSGSCGGGGRGHHAPPNEIPRVLSLERSFKNDGRVYYRILGEDRDGLVVRIETVYNGEMKEHGGSEALLDNEILQEGEHVLEVRVFDDQGGIGYDEDRFMIPRYEDALRFIQERFDEDLQRGGFQGYEDTLVTLDDQQREISPDFVLLRKDDFPAIIEYVGVHESLEEKQEDHQWLHELGIPHLYLFRLPLRDEMSLDGERRLQAFIDSGYLVEIEE